MEPRQLRLPGFTRLWASEFWASERRRIRIRERQPLRAVGQRVFVSIRAIEQQHALILADEAAFERLPPCRDHRAALRAEQEPVVARNLLDRLQNRVLRHR